jgi:hypothetical protein
MGEMRNTFKVWENMEVEDNLEDLGIDGRIILKWTLKNRMAVNRIHEAQDKGQWRASVN